jgi:hypothetical protein
MTPTPSTKGMLCCILAPFSNPPSLSETSLKVRFLKVRVYFWFCNEITLEEGYLIARKEK